MNTYRVSTNIGEKMQDEQQLHIEDDRLLKFGELARMLRCNRATLKNWIEESNIQPIKVGPKTIRYRRSEVEKLLGGDE